MAKDESPGAESEKAKREARLAQALRANLRRRKASTPPQKPSNDSSDKS